MEMNRNEQWLRNKAEAESEFNVNIGTLTEKHLYSVLIHYANETERVKDPYHNSHVVFIVKADCYFGAEAKALKEIEKWNASKTNPNGLYSLSIVTHLDFNKLQSGEMLFITQI